nr:transmembrane and immunoglobulin domain-containing protein 2 isoform X2 [Paramormyrops kingsleyae]
MIWFIFLSLISNLKCTSGNAAAPALFSVRQEPEVMEVAPGSNVTMKCHYQGNFAAGGRIRVNWKSNLLITTTDIVNVTGIQNGFVCLNLTSVRSNQSGTYVCEVSLEIPRLSHMEGNGTVLIVRDSVAVSDTRKHIFFIALWTALSMAALTVGTGFLICCKYKRTKPASSTGENDCQVSDALESEVQYATLNVRLKSPRPDSRGGQGQNLGIEMKPESPRSPRNEEFTEAVYSAIRRPTP